LDRHKDWAPNIGKEQYEGQEGIAKRNLENKNRFSLACKPIECHASVPQYNTTHKITSASSSAFKGSHTNDFYFLFSPSSQPERMDMTSRESHDLKLIGFQCDIEIQREYGENLSWSGV
jgi:hypothetical protein